MLSESSVASSPFFWVFLAGMALGFAVAVLTVVPRRTAYPSRTRRLKTVKFSLWLSIVFLFGLAAVFLPGPEKILDLRLLYVTGCAFIVGGVGYRFPKAAGIPLILLAGVWILLLQYSVRDYETLIDDSVLLEYTMLSTSSSSGEKVGDSVSSSSVGSEAVSFEISSKGNSKIVQFESGEIEFELEIVEFSEYYFLFAPLRKYRILQPTELRNELSPYVTEILAILPGLKFQSLRISKSNVIPFKTFSLRLKNNDIIIEKSDR